MEKMIDMTIWELIIILLEEKNMTIYDLVKAVRPVSPSAVYGLRKGTTKNPRFTTMVKIAEALDVSLDVFADCKM